MKWKEGQAKVFWLKFKTYSFHLAVFDNFFGESYPGPLGIKRIDQSNNSDCSVQKYRRAMFKCLHLGITGSVCFGDDLTYDGHK